MNQLLDFIQRNYKGTSVSADVAVGLKDSAFNCMNRCECRCLHVSRFEAD